MTLPTPAIYEWAVVVNRPNAVGLLHVVRAARMKTIAVMLENSTPPHCRDLGSHHLRPQFDAGFSASIRLSWAEEEAG